MNPEAPPAPGAPVRRIATVPNVLSFLRLGSVPVFLWLWFAGSIGAAVTIYALGAATDFLDGFIARRLAQVSELGKLLDPLADRVFIVALAVALIGSGALPWPLAAAVILRDALVLSLYPLFQRRGIQRIEVNFVGKSATAALLVGLTCLAASETGASWTGVGESIGLASIVVGAALYWVAGGMYLREALRRTRSLGTVSER